MHIIKEIIMARLILFIYLLFSSNAFGDNDGFKLNIDSNQNVTLTIKLEENDAIYSNDGNKDNYPLNVEIINQQNVESYEVIYPKGEYDTDKKDKVYKHLIKIPINFYAINSNEPLSTEIKIIYAICSKNMCIPREDSFSLSIANPVTFGQGYNILYIATFALLGGFILNFMPCVLPVLAIKLSSISTLNKKDPISAKFSLLSIMLGMYLSYLALSLAAFYLKTIGIKVGLGLNFQNPQFVIFLILILSYVAFRLKNPDYDNKFSFELPEFMQKFLNVKFNYSYIDDFCHGIITTLLATPCAAPFLTTAVSYILILNSLPEVILLTSLIAIGSMLPYIFLLININIVKYFPSSDAAVSSFKTFSVFLCSLSIIWLLSILFEQIGLKPTMFVILMLILIKYLEDAKILYNNFFKFIAFIIIIVSMYKLPMMLYKENTNNEAYINNKYWQALDIKKIPELIQDDKVVFVNVTASWCLTCKVNNLIINDKNFLETLTAHNSNLVLMRGDITRQNKEISDFVYSHGGAGIPFNIIFSKKYQNGKMLPTIVLQRHILESIEK
jgi:suppressor for copper-sensitivity B